jgi:hypothetical protein
VSLGIDCGFLVVVLFVLIEQSSACIFVVEEYTMEDYVGMYVCTEGVLEFNILFQFLISCDRAS